MERLGKYVILGELFDHAGFEVTLTGLNSAEDFALLKGPTFNRLLDDLFDPDFETEAHLEDIKVDWALGSEQLTRLNSLTMPRLDMTALNSSCLFTKT